MHKHVNNHNNLCLKILYITSSSQHINIVDYMHSEQATYSIFYYPELIHNTDIISVLWWFPY